MPFSTVTQSFASVSTSAPVVFPYSVDDCPHARAQLCYFPVADKPPHRWPPSVSAPHEWPPQITVVVNGVSYVTAPDVPLDITSLWRELAPGESMVCVFASAPPAGRYVWTLQVTRFRPIPELEHAIVFSNKGATYAGDETRAKDALEVGVAGDVECMSRGVSFSCPVSLSRMIFPSRGIGCTHVDCFDLRTYLQLNAIGGKWACVVCQKRVLPADIVVDAFLHHALQNKDATGLTLFHGAPWKYVSGRDAGGSSSASAAESVVIDLCD